jgi:hypothetical protein
VQKSEAPYSGAEVALGAHLAAFHGNGSWLAFSLDDHNFIKATQARVFGTISLPNAFPLAKLH